MKPISFQTYKKLCRMSLNEFNRWAGLIWAKGFADGQDMLSEEVIVEIGEEDLLRTVMSVKGIGEKRARQVVEAIVNYNWKDEIEADKKVLDHSNEDMV